MTERDKPVSLQGQKKNTIEALEAMIRFIKNAKNIRSATFNSGYQEYENLGEEEFRVIIPQYRTFKLEIEWV